MSDIVVEFLCSMPNQNTCAFYFPMNSEPKIIDVTQVPFHDEEVNEGTERHAVLFQYQRFILRRFVQDKTKSNEDTL